MTRTRGLCVLTATLLSSCSYLPAAEEKSRTEQTLREIPDVMLATVGCGARMFASDRLCVDVVTKDDAHLTFQRVGFSALGSSAMNVFISSVNHLEPRVATCNGVGAPNFHRSAALGHRFRPSLLDLTDAVERHREVIKDIQYWPECPQFWETQDVFGMNHRYCARKTGAREEPPRPDNCR